MLFNFSQQTWEPRTWEHYYNPRMPEWVFAIERIAMWAQLKTAPSPRVAVAGRTSRVSKRHGVLTHNEIVLFRRSERGTALVRFNVGSHVHTTDTCCTGCLDNSPRKKAESKCARYVSTNYTPRTKSRLRTRYTDEVYNCLTIYSWFSPPLQKMSDKSITSRLETHVWENVLASPILR